MFLKRLSTALFALMCFGGFVLGTNPEIVPNANKVVEENLFAAPLDIPFTLSGHSPRCTGESNGSIDVQIGIGYAAPFSYQLQYNGGALLPAVTGQGQSFTISNLKSGNYTIYVKDNNGATGYNSLPLSDPTVMDVFLESPVSQPLCSGGTSNLLFGASGGNNSGYTFQLFKNGISDGSNTNGDFLNKGDGSYSVIVTDASGCQKNYNGTIVVNVPDVINVNYSIVQNINCENSTAAIDVNNLPTQSFTIELFNSTLNKTYTTHDANYVFNNLDAGVYKLSVLSTLCPADNQVIQPITISGFNPVVISTSPNSPVSLLCGGVNDLTDVSVTINGGKTGAQVRVVLDNNNGLDDDEQGTIVYGGNILFANVAQGNYTIRWNDVTDPSCTGSAPYVINAPPSPLEFTSLPVQKTASCYGENNGTIDFSVTGGVGNYTYWVGTTSYTSPGSIILSPGNHSLYVKDQNGCTTSTESFYIEQTPQLSVKVLTAQTEQLTCVGGSTGRIVVETTGGNRPYYYTLNRNGNATSYVNTPGDNTFSFTGLPAGNYSINVTDGICAAGATAQEEIKTLNPIQVGYVLNPETVTCRDEPTTMWINAHEGVIGKLFTYSLFKNGKFVKSETETEYSTGVGFSNLTPANYTVWIKYDDACDSILQTVNIYNPKQFIVSYPDTVALNCFGDVAQAKITASGEYSFSYSLDGASFTNFQNLGTTTISNLSAGVHDLVFKDSKGCEYNGGAPVSIVVEEPDEINLSVQTPNPKVSCTGSSDAQVTLQVLGGTPAFSVAVELGGNTVATKLTDSNGLVTFNLPAGNDFGVTVTDIDKGCVKPFSNVFSVSAPSSPFDIVSVDIAQQQLSCFGDSTRVEVTVAGGWGGNYTVNVQGGGINKNLPANNVIYLKAGTYNFIATDLEYGCIARENNVVISQPNKLILSVLHHNNVSCNGAADADIALSVSGGTIPYYWGVNGVATIAPSNEFSSASITLTDAMVSLSQGTYDVVIEDVNGCISNIKKVVISEPDPITFDVAKDTFVTCYGKSDATITLSNVKGGSNRDYKSLISTGGPETEGSLVIGNLGANIYTVRVVDGSGVCYSEPVSVEIKEPSEISFLPNNFEVEGIKCYGVNEGRIKLDAAGGLPFTLEYRITSGSFDSGYSSNNEFTDLAPGSYTAWVRNSKGNCAIQYGLALTVNNVLPLSLTETVITNVSCYNLQDGAVTLKATGGTGQLTYTLTNALSTVTNNPNNSGTFTGLGDANKNSTVYNYRIEDLNQCYIEGSFTIENPPLLTIDLKDKTDVVCHNEGNGTITLQITGGTGSYSLKDLNFASLAYDITNVSLDEFKINKLGTTAPSTMYLPSVMDANGCVATLSSDVEIVNPDQVEILTVDWGNKLCFGDDTDSIIIHARGGTGHFYYSLDDGLSYSILNDSIFIGESAGTKFPKIKDENGCNIAGDKYEYVEPEPITVKYEFLPIRCYDDMYGDMKLAITGGTGQYYLSINDPNFISSNYPIDRSTTDTTEFQLLEHDIQLADDITYKFYLRDDNNCHITNIEGVNDYTKVFAQTVFRIPQKLVLDSLKQQGVTCRNERTGKILFAATGGTTDPTHGYVLTAEHQERPITRTNSNGQFFIDNLFAGPYICKLTDANGCVAETDLSPKFDYDTITVAYNYDSINFTISEIIQPTCNMTLDGSLKINVADYQFQGAIAYVDYLQPALNEYQEFDDADTIIADEDYKRNITSDYSLYFATDQLIAEYVGIGTYAITVKDIYTGCSDSIHVDIASIEGDSCPPVKNYNVFTPFNDDGVNDIWIIHGLQHQEYRLQIYTAWGELVYSKHDIADNEGVKWTGVDNKNRPVPVGTYIYLLEKYIGTPKDTVTNGNITILRSDGRW